MGAYVYILICRDDAYYIGSTRDSLESRVAEHNTGRYGNWTTSRLPARLAFAQHFANITDAIAAERQIKGWSRAKKDALIAGAFHLLPELSRNRTQFPKPVRKDTSS